LSRSQNCWLDVGTVIVEALGFVGQRMQLEFRHPANLR
jgi:hypothetical protein